MIGGYVTENTNALPTSYAADNSVLGIASTPGTNYICACAAAEHIP